MANNITILLVANNDGTLTSIPTGGRSFCCFTDNCNHGTLLSSSNNNKITLILITILIKYLF